MDITSFPQEEASFRSLLPRVLSKISEENLKEESKMWWNRYEKQKDMDPSNQHLWPRVLVSKDLYGEKRIRALEPKDLSEMEKALFTSGADIVDLYGDWFKKTRDVAFPIWKTNNKLWRAFEYRCLKRFKY